MGNDAKRKSNLDYESQQLINFFEELCWLIDSNKELSFKNASKLLKQCRSALALDSPTNNGTDAAYSLIGVLPSLLKDGEIFQNNAQLVQFAEEVLALNISRWEKRSRNELIGLIICEVEDVNDKERLDVLTRWASNLLNHKNQVKDMQSKAQKAGNIFSWNETIQKLVGTEYE